MSSVTGNHAIDLLYLLKDTFKNLLFDLLIIGRSFENLPYLSKCSLSRRWRFWRIRSNVLWGIKSGLAYAKVSEVTSQKYWRSPRKSIGGQLAKVSGVNSQKYRRSPRKSIGGQLAKVSEVTSQKYRRSPRKSIGGHLAKVSAVTSQKYRGSPRKSIGGHLTIYFMVWKLMVLRKK